MKYKVRRYYEYAKVYEVEATDADDAIDKVGVGLGTFIDQTLAETVDWEASNDK